jgi:excisionase family DNA binding protein
MKDTTHQMVKLALDADDTVSDADRRTILAVCRNPNLTASHEASSQLPRFVSVGQAASLLSVHPRTIWRFIGRRRLRSVMVGGSRRVSTDDLAAFVERCGGKSADLHVAYDSAGSNCTPPVRLAEAS